MVLLVQRGWDPDYLFDLDILSFRSLHQGSQRIAAAESIEGAWLSMMAAQGSVKGMKKILKPLTKMLDRKALAGGDDQAAFLKKYSGGI